MASQNVMSKADAANRKKADSLQPLRSLAPSDQTPWQDLSENQVGWALPLCNKQRFVDVLTDVAGWDEARWMAHEEAICSYASMTNIAGQNTQNHLKMFDKVAKLHGS